MFQLSGCVIRHDDLQDAQNKWTKWFISVWQHGFSADWAEKFDKFSWDAGFKTKAPWDSQVTTSLCSQAPFVMLPGCKQLHTIFTFTGCGSNRRPLFFLHPRIFRAGKWCNKAYKARFILRLKSAVLSNLTFKKPHSWKHHQFSAKKPGFQSWNDGRNNS